MVDQATIEKWRTSFIRKFEWNGKMIVSDFIYHNVDRLEKMYVEREWLSWVNKDDRVGTNKYDQYMDDTAIQIMKERYDLFLEDN